MKKRDILNSNLEKIRELFPNVITETVRGYAIDFDLLKQELSYDLIDEKEKYQLTWVGKKDSIITANTSITKTLRPVKEKSVDFENTKNIYIEGDNLDALKILQESYLNKVKCIYIDPPYNTGKDFIFNDKFTDLEKEINKLNKNKKNHNAWLSFMYPRLLLARNLLSEDGIIFISIDDNEQANLKLLCDEIFDEENFIAQIVWTNKEGGGGSDTKLIKIKHEYILCYAKYIDKALINGIKISDEERYTYEDKWVETRGKYQMLKLKSASLGYVDSLDYPIIAPDGTEVFPNKNNEKISRWRWSKTKLQWGIENDYLEFKKDKNGDWDVYSKQYLKADENGNIIERTNRPFAVIDKYSSTQASKQVKNY